MAKRKFQITFIVEADDADLPRNNDQAINLITDLAEEAWDKASTMGARSAIITDSYGFQGDAV